LDWNASLFVAVIFGAARPAVAAAPARPTASTMQTAIRRHRLPGINAKRASLRTQELLLQGAVEERIFTPSPAVMSCA
jgi:hypothetical protein